MKTFSFYPGFVQCTLNVDPSYNPKIEQFRKGVLVILLRKMNNVIVTQNNRCLKKC